MSENTSKKIFKEGNTSHLFWAFMVKHEDSLLMNLKIERYHSDSRKKTRKLNRKIKKQEKIVRMAKQNSEQTKVKKYE